MMVGLSDSNSFSSEGKSFSSETEGNVIHSHLMVSRSHLILMVGLCCLMTSVLKPMIKHCRLVPNIVEKSYYCGEILKSFSYDGNSMEVDYI
jgi:hypothetical protein